MKEFLAPLAIIDLVSCVVMRNGAAWAGITFTRHEDAGPVRETEVEAFCLLGPHFRRAVEIGNLLDMKTIEAAGLASALEALSAGLVLVDREARVIHANAAARAMLDAADPIRLVRGRLCLPTPLASDALADAIARSAGSLGQLGQRGISIPARMKDGRPCVAHVLPMRGGEARWGVGRRAITAVFIARAETGPQMPAAALDLAYDVTPAEARVLELIAEGRKPKVIAETLGVSIATVKTHLARLFQKTGTSRQAELVALIGRMTLPLV